MRDRYLVQYMRDSYVVSYMHGRAAASRGSRCWSLFCLGGTAMEQLLLVWAKLVLNGQCMSTSVMMKVSALPREASVHLSFCIQTA